MEEEPVEIAPREVAHRLGGRRRDAHPPHGRQVERVDPGRERLAAVRALLVLVAERERDDVLVAHQRTAAFEVRQHRGPRPVAKARSIDAASPFGFASG